MFGKQNRVARVCIATVLIFGLSQQISLGSVSLSWSELPQFPNSVGVAGPFVGVHNDALIVSGGANFQPPVWQAEKEWHDDIFVLVRSDNTYLWKEAGTLPRPIAYGAAVSTSDGVVCMGGNDAETTLDQVFLMQWDAALKKVRLVDYPSLPGPCAFGSAVVVDNVIYLAGGQSGQSLTTAMKNFWSQGMY